jgi:tripartite-type tricarboxylate transporter receptor subunit TctC
MPTGILARYVRARTATAIAGTLAGGLAIASAPSSAADFYKDKTINLVVGANPGGVFDIVARSLARYMPPKVPGRPSIVVQNMFGAGSARATEWLANIAPKDGTTFAAVFPSVLLGPLIDDTRTYRFDPLSFHTIGSGDSGARICVTFHTSKIKTFHDAQKTDAVVGATAGGGSTFDYAWMLKNLAGAKFKIVTGYKGTPDLKIALERGEIDGFCGYSLAALRAEKIEWFTEKKLNIIVYFGHEPDRELEDMKVPEVAQFVSGDGLKAIRLIISQQAFARPYIAPKEVPADRIAILRKGFDAAVADPAMRAEFAKLGAPLTPVSGEKMQKIVADLYASPKPIVELARRAQRPPK